MIKSAHRLDDVRDLITTAHRYQLFKLAHRMDRHMETALAIILIVAILAGWGAAVNWSKNRTRN